jgi:hypothetical protein
MTMHKELPLRVWLSRQRTPPAPPRSFTAMLAYDASLIDVRLPSWARRSHPVVKRHLGQYWKVISPEWGELIQMALLMLGLLWLSWPMQGLFMLVGSVALTGCLLMPALLWFYGRALYEISATAVDAMHQAVEEQHFILLRITPLSLITLLLSRAAAAVWRQAETLTPLLWAACWLGLPLVMIEASIYIAPDQYPLQARLWMMVAYALSLLRLVLEPLLVALVAMLITTLNPQRWSATLATVGFMLLYFGALNLPRLWVVDLSGYIWISVLLPLLLVLVGIGVALALTAWLIVRE